MGREIRFVPPNWEHPKREKPNFLTGQLEESFQPMFDFPFVENMDQWIEGYQKWKKGELDWQSEGEYKDLTYWEYAGGPPNPEYYRPEWKEEPTWIQVYETVSEGTPVSPAFATKEELIDYLAKNGDFWDQKRRKEGNSYMNCDPWGRDRAERFVNAGWAPSFISNKGVIKQGTE